MMQTKAKHLFENGYYPKGGVGIVSEMPLRNGIANERHRFGKSTTIEINCRSSKENHMT